MHHQEDKTTNMATEEEEIKVDMIDTQVILEHKIKTKVKVSRDKEIIINNRKNFNNNDYKYYSEYK